MKAMVITEFGGPDVFELREVPKPEIGPNQVLVRVHATSVNPVDLGVRQAGSWAGVQPPAVIGYDVSGVVEAVGPGVTDVIVGDEVYYSPEISGRWGSYAEYNAVDAAIVARKPTNLSHAEAASIPLAGCAAWDGLITKANLMVGETILIHGAGGVGSLAVQIAKAAGAFILAVCSDYMVDPVAGLGADRAIDYKSEDFVEVVRDETDRLGVDVVFDTVGGDALARSIEVVKPYGRMVGIVRSAKGDWGLGFGKNLTLYMTRLERMAYKLDALCVLIERGQIEPVIDSVLPITDVAEAHRRLAAGGVKGKIVLDTTRFE
jgi:NADPH:quinone reductase